MEISNSMNKYFSTIGSNLATNLERPSVSFEHYIQPSKCTFKLQETNPETVQNLLSNLKTSKSTGLDNISCRLLKEAAPIVAKSLCNIFNKSIASGKFPTEWKQSKVIPIHKNGDKDSSTNYRPISILLVVSKVFERIVFNQLYEYFNTNNLLSKDQSGFRPLHSTMTALPLRQLVNGLQI